MPLDEYYYGKKEGDPAYREEKGEFRFKVSILYNQRHEVIHQIASSSQVYTQANGLFIVYAVTSSVAYILTADCTC